MPRPLLTFTPEMFLAALDGFKGCTRRLAGPGDSPDKPPYGPARTYVPIATTWSIAAEFDSLRPKDCPTDLVAMKGIFWHLPGFTKPAWAGKARPARFIPRSMYHLCPSVRLGNSTLEHLDTITDADAMAEGIAKFSDQSAAPGYWRIYGTAVERGTPSPRLSYFSLWDTINANRAPAASNPMCWRIPFKIASRR